jgi:iron(III) transport system substrate-binding protein
MKLMFYGYRIRVSLLMTVLLSLARLGWAQTDAKLIEAAKKEGKLVWYTSTSLTESKPLLDDFEKLYPFVTGEIFRASGEKTLNRIMTESRAGRWDFDVVTINEVDALMDVKLLGAYKSPEAKNFIADFKDPNGYWTADYVNYMTMGYNPKLINEKEAPKSWEDLLETKWKGKIAMDQEEYVWYATLAKAWGKERTQKYMRALAKQNIDWRKGHTLITQMMAAGEFPLSIVYAHRAEGMKQKGAPVDWVSTANPIVATINCAALSPKPAHPTVARLFIDFILSKPAQLRIRSLNRIPARADVEPLSPRMEQSKLKLKISPPETGAEFKETIREFREVFGL